MKRFLLLFALTAIFATGLQAQIVGANANEGQVITRNSSEYTPKGHYLRVETGFPNLITMAYAYQVTPWMMVGAGGGFGLITYDHYTRNYHYKRLDTGLPFYTEIKFSTPKKRFSFIADYKVGFNVPLNNYYNSYSSYSISHYGKTFYSALSIGLEFGNFGFFAGVSSNSANVHFLAGFSYDIPLKVY